MGFCSLACAPSVEEAPEERPLPSDLILLPLSLQALPDDVDEDESRPVLDICADGRMFAGRKLLWNPYQGDSDRVLFAWLDEVASNMTTGPMPDAGKDPPTVAMGELLIRADASAPFGAVGYVMTTCRVQELPIWRIQLATRPPLEVDGTGIDRQTAAAGRIDLFLPGDPALYQVCSPVETCIKVLQPGVRISRGTQEPLGSARQAAFDYTPDREVVYSLGPRRCRDPDALGKALALLYRAGPHWPARIEAGKGVTCGEVVEVLDSCLEVGFTSFMMSHYER
jgi:hypothetical protein